MMVPAKSRVFLIHWNASEASELAKRLAQVGYDVEFGMPNAAGIRALGDNPPDIFVIDLSRLPTQGRDVGLVIRQGRVTRLVPIIFVDGLPEKVDNVKKFLPDATYAKRDKLSAAIERAIANPPKNPVVPKTVLDAYSGTPLPKKLGLKAGCRIALINPPSGFKNLIGELPSGAKYISKQTGRGDLVIWFVKSLKDIQAEIIPVSKLLATRGGLWICWPKKTSDVKSDLSEKAVRQIGLASGLVDYKVCAIDQTWSGLKFARRKQPQ
jgi:hypothetical protein